MKKSSIFFVLVLFSALLSAQTEQPTRTSSISKDKMMLYQMGTGQTTNGVFTLNFDATLLYEYTIMLTPYSGSTSLFIAEKTADKFVIRSADGSNITFDFIVFIKKPAPQPVPQQ